MNSLSTPAADGNANPDSKALMGPVASFAGDAQTLSQALGAGDEAGARRATAALDADAASVDAALKAHGGAIKPAIQPDRWDALKHELAAIEKSVPPAPASAAPPPASPPLASGAPASTDAAAPGAAVMPPAADRAAGAASAPAPRAADSGGPTIKIESRTVVGDVTHLKGYFEGSALQAAGIYEGAQSVKPIKVDHVLGSQKVEFQLSLRDADIATNLRVIDQAGRVATASVFGEDSTAMASTGTESGVEVDRGTGATAGSNTAEIPSASAPASGLGESAPDTDEGLDSGGIGGGLGGGGLGGGIGAPVGNVQINIESVNPVNPLSHVYQVVGQIIGPGVNRAGIYVDGRLVKRLPVSRGASVSNFHTTFMMNGGTATIRAFSAGNQYVESSIAMPPAVASAPPIMVAPYGMNPYSPFGMNPYPMDPYGSPFGVPYGTPYGAAPSYGINISPYGITRYPISPYGASPYGASPYGAVPYGAVPFGVNPYAAPINPYTNARPISPSGH